MDHNEWWLDMVDILSNESPINLVSLGLGIVGIILAIYFYQESRRVKRLTFDLRSFPLLSETTAGLPGFSASYRGGTVENLTATKLILWNSGSEVVSGSDIPPADPLRIKVSENEGILNCNIISSSHSANQINIERDYSKIHSAYIRFDYLSPGDGAVITALHTDTVENIHLAGTIKGGSLMKWKPPLKWSYTLLAIGMITAFMGADKISKMFSSGVASAAAYIIVLALIMMGLVAVLNRIERRGSGDIAQKYKKDYDPKEF